VIARPTGRTKAAEETEQYISCFLGQFQFTRLPQIWRGDFIALLLLLLLLLLLWVASVDLRRPGHGELLREQDQLRERLRLIPFFRVEMEEEGRAGAERLEQPGVLLAVHHHDGAPDP